MAVRAEELETFCIAMEFFYSQTDGCAAAFSMELADELLFLFRFAMVDLYILSCAGIGIGCIGVGFVSPFEGVRRPGKWIDSSLSSHKHNQKNMYG